MTARKIYLASSWRNLDQPFAVNILRGAGHEVYDFRNPVPGDIGFAWSDIDPDWLNWTPGSFIHSMASVVAAEGFNLDKTGLDWCDTCVLLLPCNRSAHLEAGYTIGQGKPTLIVCSATDFEPELMYLLADKVVPNLHDMVSALEGLRHYATGT